MNVIDILNNTFSKPVSRILTLRDLEETAIKCENRADRDSNRPRPIYLKFVDNLMEVAEPAVMDSIPGFVKGKGYDDLVACNPLPISGVVEVKTKDPWTNQTSIRCQGSYSWMLVLNRLFSKSDLASEVEKNGPDSLIGLELKFQPVEILKFNNGSRDPYWKLATKKPK